MENVEIKKENIEVACPDFSNCTSLIEVSDRDMLAAFVEAIPNFYSVRNLLI